MSTLDKQSSPHLAILPSSGMGHLTPFLRLAATLSTHSLSVFLITIHPQVSSAESNHIFTFLSTYPKIKPLKFHLPPLNPTTSKNTDPFFLQFEAIRQSAHLLIPLLSSSSITSIITDVSLTSAINPITRKLNIPNHILFTSSASMLAFCSHFPSQFSCNNKQLNLPEVFHIHGLPSIPKTSIPPALLDPTNLFTTQFVENGIELVNANSILVNTFEELEEEVLKSLNSGNVVQGLPPVVAIGPLEQCEFEKGKPPSWLDSQPDGSVLYVSFGSRTALCEEQIKELGYGLERSGCRFVWVLKSKVVDKNEDREELEKVLGIGFVERNKEKGLVVMDWVEQSEILGHKAVGGFLSHCGWNSVTEAAWFGVPILAWPQLGDQRINARVVERSGLGVWEEKWEWKSGEIIKGVEIGEKVRDLMMNEGVKRMAKMVKEMARMAVGNGGTSNDGLRGWLRCAG